MNLNRLNSWVRLILISLVGLIAFDLAPRQGWAVFEVAVTVDDLPGGGVDSSVKWKPVCEKMTDGFKKHRVSGVYGFVNSGRIQKDSELEKVLECWVRAGHFLGNHTLNHTDIDQVSTPKYSAEIFDNESIIKKWMGQNDFRYFRYPFLAEGETLEKRTAVRRLLLDKGYKIAPVTMDFFDYEWEAPYTRCLKKQDQEALKWLRESYVEQAMNGMEIARALSKSLFGRDIKYVLLIHIGIIQAEVLDILLTQLETQGAKFVPLPEALSDEVYQIDPKIAQKRSYTLLNQIRLSRGVSNPNRVKELYDSLPEDKLMKICR